MIRWLRSYDFLLQGLSIMMCIIRCFHRKTSVYIYLLISVSGALAEAQWFLRAQPALSKWFVYVFSRQFFFRQITTYRVEQEKQISLNEPSFATKTLSISKKLKNYLTKTNFLKVICYKNQVICLHILPPIFFSSNHNVSRKKKQISHNKPSFATTTLSISKKLKN